MSDELAGTQREILESLRHLSQKLDVVTAKGDSAAQAILEPPTYSTKSCQDQELRDLYDELQSLEHALVSEKEKASILVEERSELQALHARDIASLEAMLQQVVEERDRLSVENRHLLAENARLKKQEKLAFSADAIKADPARDLLEQRMDATKMVYSSWDRSGSHAPTEQEPDLEQSCAGFSSGSSVRDF